MFEFSMGSDPEFVLEKDGKICSAIGIVKGTKDRRKKIGNCAFYYDNVLAECAIPPGKTKEEVIFNIRDCLQKYSTLVFPYKLEARASHFYDADQLKHKAAMEISCDPETCAYRVEDTTPDIEAFRQMTLRTAGGHIHLGSEVLRGYNRIVCVFLLDLFLGLPSIFIDHDPTSKKRKELFGQAGRYRTPVYGIEYRSLGNFWLSSPKLVEFVYDVCEFVLDFIEKDKWQSLWKIDEERLESDEAWSDLNFHPCQCYQCIGYDVGKLRQSIDTVNVKTGQEFLDFIKQYMPSKLHAKIFRLAEPNQYDLYEEWRIDD